VSTPASVELPDGVRHTKIRTGRGSFAALEARPEHGVCERDTALLVPGYTGSKEDFIAVLDLLAAGGRRVLAIDMRGQYQSAGGEDDSFTPASLAADVGAVVKAAGVKHLLGHSYGGLVTRQAVLDEGLELSSFTLMSSGPGALNGPRAAELTASLAALDGRSLADLWQAYLGPQAAAAGVPAVIQEFLRDRFLANAPNGLVLMARNLLSAPDRTGELARHAELPMLVVYGEDDNTWSPAAQEAMARRLGALRVCIPGAVHSPNVEAPATTAGALTEFWDAAEAAHIASTAESISD
jgi:pimeloyl-ACP methyl ester carboxylesterase